MSITNSQRGSEVVSALLRGTQLDTIRVFSLIVQLGFIRSGGAEDLPQEVWVSVSGNLVIGGESSTTGETSVAGDFFNRRALALCESYRLIGREVSAARVSDSGALEIDLGERGLRAEADEDGDLEEIWSVMSESPDLKSDHRWYVSLDDSGGLSAHVPS